MMLCRELKGDREESLSTIRLYKSNLVFENISLFKLEKRGQMDTCFIGTTSLVAQFQLLVVRSLNKAICTYRRAFPQDFFD